MLKLEVFMDEHHIGSIQSLAKIIAADWPAMTIRVHNGSETREYSQGSDEPNNLIPHSCQHCTLAIKDAISGTSRPTANAHLDSQCTHGFSHHGKNCVAAACAIRSDHYGA